MFSDIWKFMLADGEARADQKQSFAQLQQMQIAYSALSRQYVITTCLASLIATLGLITNSSVAIVGAMLIAPLMKPIMALSFGLIHGSPRLYARALITLALGTLLAILVALITTWFIGLQSPTTEILTRTRPSLIDLGIAMAAGTAAAIASTRINVADTLPGVAIAVALAPPVCVIGIGLALGAWFIATGAALLFLVNLISIVFTVALFLVLEGYGSLKPSWPGALVILIIGAIAYGPLQDALNTLQADDHAQEAVEVFLTEEHERHRSLHPNDLARLITLVFEDHVFVFMELRASAEDFNELRGQELHRRLSALFDVPVNLRLQLLLTEDRLYYTHLLPSGDLPVYGHPDMIPLR